MRPLLLGLAALFLVTACGSDESYSRATNPDGTSAIQIRPLLEVCAEGSDATAGTAVPETSDVPADAEGLVLLVDTTQYCRVGPSQADGSVFAPKSKAVEDNRDGWVVLLQFPYATTGEARWNEVAGQCYDRAETCPTGQVAIVIHGVAYSVATVNVPSFANNIQISGDFTEDEARDLAKLINAGAV